MRTLDLFALDKPLILVVLLALTTPLRSDVDAVFFLLVTLLFGLVDRGRLVLRWRVDGIEDQRCRTSIDELMLGACRDDNEISSLDVLVFPRNGGFAGTGGEGQDLVNGMDLGVS